MEKKLVLAKKWINETKLLVFTNESLIIQAIHYYRTCFIRYLPRTPFVRNLIDHF